MPNLHSQGSGLNLRLGEVSGESGTDRFTLQGAGLQINLPLAGRAALSGSWALPIEKLVIRQGESDSVTAEGLSLSGSMKDITATITEAASVEADLNLNRFSSRMGNQAIDVEGMGAQLTGQLRSLSSMDWKLNLPIQIGVFDDPTAGVWAFERLQVHRILAQSLFKSDHSDPLWSGRRRWMWRS